MQTNVEVERLQIDLDHLISQYEKCEDPDVVRVVKRLKKVRKKFDPGEALDTAAKILEVADRIRDLFDQLPPFF